MIETADDKFSPLLHVLRLKRFDINMFGCNECRPVIECTSDVFCQRQHGENFRCEQVCCSRSIKCMLRERDEDLEASYNGLNCEEEECEIQPVSETSESSSGSDTSKDGAHAQTGNLPEAPESGSVDDSLTLTSDSGGPEEAPPGPGGPPPDDAYRFP